MAYVARRVHDKQAREDIVQETFLGAVRGIDGYDPVYTFEQYLFGIGAMMAKHARCRPVTAVYLSGRLLWRFIFGRPVVELGTSLRRWIRMRAFLRGLLAGWRTPRDRATCRYRGAVTFVGR